MTTSRAKSTDRDSPGRAEPSRRHAAGRVTSKRADYDGEKSVSIAQEIRAVVRQDKVDDVLRALRLIPGMPGVTVSLVRAFGKAEPGGPGEAAEGLMARLETVVVPAMADVVIDTITEAAWTGQPGDGKCFVLPVERVVNIARRKHGPGAI